MSYNKTPINGIKIKCDGLSQPWSKQSVHLEANIKLAGEEAKDRLYEPKHKKKLVRVLTVIAYVFFVSLAAIMLSLYYILLWNGDQKVTNKYQMYESKIQMQQPRCNDIVAVVEMKQQIIETITENTSFDVTTSTTDSSILWTDSTPPPPPLDSLEDDYMRRDESENKSLNYDDND